jgi:hypothetical protein
MTRAPDGVRVLELACFGRDRAAACCCRSSAPRSSLYRRARAGDPAHRARSFLLQTQRRETGVDACGGWLPEC